MSYSDRVHCYFVLPRGKAQVPFTPPLSLEKPGFTDYGPGSFRGEVYEDIINVVSGVTLYKSKLPAAVVKKIASDFTVTTFKRMCEASSARISREEFDDIKRLFKVMAEANAELHSWW